MSFTDRILLICAAFFFGISVLSVLFTGLRSFFRDSTDGRDRSLGINYRGQWWFWLSVSLCIASFSFAVGILQYLAFSALFFVMAMIQGIGVKFTIFGEYDIQDREKYPELYKTTTSVDDPKTCLSQERISIAQFEFNQLKHRQQLGELGRQEQGSLDQLDSTDSDTLPYWVDDSPQSELGTRIEHQYSPDIEEVRENLRSNIKLTLGSFFFSFLLYKSISVTSKMTLVFCYIGWVVLAGAGIVGAFMCLIGYSRYLGMKIDGAR